MIRKLLALLAWILGGCDRADPEHQPNVNRSGLVVTCTPNPCDVHTHPTVSEPPYSFMWYYRTEVRNTTDVPLRVVWFEAFHQEGGQWVAGNITGRTLTAQDFSEWYADGEKIVDGVIPPGRAAVDGRNWHGSSVPKGGPVKWAYTAEDPSGGKHYAEVIIESVAINE